MIPLWLAKIALLTSASALAYVTPLKCGTYEATGILRKGNLGHYVLSLRDKTTTRFDLVLLGGSLKDRQNRLRTRVLIEFYVPEPIENRDSTFVFLQKIKTGFPDSEKHDTPKLKRVEACRLKEKYVN